MGAGASAFRKKGAVEKRAAENKTEAAAKKKTAVEATAENQADGKVEKVPIFLLLREYGSTATGVLYS